MEEFGSRSPKARNFEKLVDPEEPDHEKEYEEKLKEKEIMDKTKRWTTTMNLEKIKFRQRCGKPIGLRWYGDGKKEDSDPLDSLFDDKDWLPVEEDDDRLGKGSDKYVIKTVSVTVSTGQNASRQAMIPDNQVKLTPGFDFMYESPLLRDFALDPTSDRRVAKDFLRVSFDRNTPDSIVGKILKDGFYCHDPHNQKNKKDSICLYRFFAYTPTQVRNRGCIMINYDSDMWDSNKLIDVEGYSRLKREFDDLAKITVRVDRAEARYSLVKRALPYVWNYFGNFNKIKIVSKYAARIGLLMSPTAATIFIPDKKWAREKDIVGGPPKNPEKYEFTDGCGRMCTRVAEMFRDKLNLKHLYRHQGAYCVPSVIQFRMMGCKGIFVHDPTLDDADKPWVMIRDSQWKFDWNMNTVKHLERDKDGNPGRAMGVCSNGFSRPFSFGKLNEQFVVLLDALGLEDNTFLNIQKDHFERLKRCMDDRIAAFEILSSEKRMDEADLLDRTDEDSPYPPEVINTLKRFRKPVFDLPSAKPDRREEKNIKNAAFYIPISKSRNVYGVADISGKLRKGECFVQITQYEEVVDKKRGTSRKERRMLPLGNGAKVLVNKCPTYHPGDFRVLQNTHVPELMHLCDVIVFPVYDKVYNPDLKRPHPHEMHESDLDGDEYFVSWDERLIPEKLEKPFPCPDKTIGANIKDEITVQDLIREFTASEHLVGRINNLFIDWAKLAGASSNECRQLAKLFNQSVDTAKHGGKVEISKHLTSVRDREAEGQRLHGKMIEQTRKQPFKATADMMIRYKGLNNTLTPIAHNPIFYLIDVNVGDSLMNFHCMLKYGVWSDPFARNVIKISDAFNATQRPGAMRPNNTIFNKRGTVYLVAYRKRRSSGKKVALGLAQVIDRIGMWEYCFTPFKFCDTGMIPVKWLFCKDFDIPNEPLFGHIGKKTLLELEHTDLIPQQTGRRLFDTFKKGKQIDPMRRIMGDKIYEKIGHYPTLIRYSYLDKEWADNEKKLQEEIKKNTAFFEANVANVVKRTLPRNTAFAH